MSQEPNGENTTVYVVDKYGPDYFAACEYCHGEILKLHLLRRYKNCPFCGRKIVKTVNAWEREPQAGQVKKEPGPCKWLSDDFNEICVNADCPLCADFCPVSDTPGVCRYEERNC